jgi:hypothetical protein
MVLTAAQRNAFFEQATQMGIPQATVIQLQAEGINNVEDLIDFDKDTIERVAANLRRPAGRVPDARPKSCGGGWCCNSDTTFCAWGCVPTSNGPHF